jgi:hypothetical protein
MVSVGHGGVSESVVLCSHGSTGWDKLLLRTIVLKKYNQERVQNNSQNKRRIINNWIGWRRTTYVHYCTMQRTLLGARTIMHPDRIFGGTSPIFLLLINTYCTLQQSWEGWRRTTD